MAFLRLEYSIKAGFVKGYFVVTYPLAPSLTYYVKGRGLGKGGGEAPSLNSLFFEGD